MVRRAHHERSGPDYILDIPGQGEGRLLLHLVRLGLGWFPQLPVLFLQLRHALAQRLNRPRRLHTVVGLVSRVSPGGRKHLVLSRRGLAMHRSMAQPARQAKEKPDCRVLKISPLHSRSPEPPKLSFPRKNVTPYHDTGRESRRIDLAEVLLPMHKFDSQRRFAIQPA